MLSARTAGRRHHRLDRRATPVGIGVFVGMNVNRPPANAGTTSVTKNCWSWIRIDAV
jgi:hypothetical protein